MPPLRQWRPPRRTSPRGEGRTESEHARTRTPTGRFIGVDRGSLPARDRLAVYVRILLVLFVVVPLAELYLLLWLGRTTGFAATLAVTLLSGLVGSALAKHQGLGAYRAWRRSLDSLTPPEVGLVEGMLILAGAILLLTPGLLSDVVGFVCLIPWTRRWLAKRIKARIEVRLAASTVRSRSGATSVRITRAQVVHADGESLDDPDPRK